MTNPLFQFLVTDHSLLIHPLTSVERTNVQRAASINLMVELRSFTVHRNSTEADFRVAGPDEGPSSTAALADKQNHWASYWIAPWRITSVPASINVTLSRLHLQSARPPHHPQKRISFSLLGMKSPPEAKKRKNFSFLSFPLLSFLLPFLSSSFLFYFFSSFFFVSFFVS